jgi:hypothetical protein
LAGNICNSSAFVFAQMKVSYHCVPALAILVVLLLLYLNCQGYATSKLTPSHVRMNFSNETENGCTQANLSRHFCKVSITLEFDNLPNIK